MKKILKLRKNHISLLLIVLGAILITISASNLYRNYEINKANKAYLSKYVLNVKYNELNNTNIEFGSDTFVVLSYLGEKDIYYLEKDLKKVIDKYDLRDNVIYVDMTEFLADNDYLKLLNDSINVESIKIKKIPAILYYKNTVVTASVDSRDGLLSSGNFQQLLEQYEIINK